MSHAHTSTNANTTNTDTLSVSDDMLIYSILLFLCHYH